MEDTMDPNTKLSASFYVYELACKGSGKLILHPGFILELQMLRDAVYERTRTGMNITSGCRSFEYNKSIGGHERSLHICDREMHPGQFGTLGVDVAAADPFYRGWLFTCAWERNWSIGWNAARKFLHIDKRVWLGLLQASFDY